MSLTRRSLLALAPSLLAASAAPASSRAPSRLLFVRHSTVLVEMGGLRVLFDPCLAPQMGAPGVVSEVTAPPPAGRMGRIDVVCVTSGDIGAYDAATVAALDVGAARFLVADDSLRKRLAHLGHRRVRVVAADDAVDIGGVVFTASPAAAVFGRGVGFHVDDGAAALWHTGSVPPLEVDARSAAFAADHPARVVCAHASGLALTSSGPPLFADVDDGVALARVARAHAVLPIGRGARPAGLFSLVLTTATTPPTRATFQDLDVIEPVPSTWYRF